ncbi:MAG: type 1 glutamine amidotransferase domain-containing protein, partial [Bacteroidota bacterium]
MFKKYRILNWVALVIASLIVLIFSFELWFKSLIPPRNPKIEATVVTELPYLSKDSVPNRGKILAVVTSTDLMGSSGKSTGYELTELSRAYYTFQANGFEVDIASPKGGEPPVVIDTEDMGPYDYAFLNDSIAQYRSKHTLKLKEVNPEDYAAVYFAGGKGAMYDFPDNKTIQLIVKDYYQSDKVIGAVCHGPAALVNVKLDNGNPLLADKRVSGFTNKEELLLIKDAETIFPFLLQDKITEQGAHFNEGPMYLMQVSHDNNVITGQNPWSTWELAEAMVSQLGYQPKNRDITDEENAVRVLSVYNSSGKGQAKELMTKLVLEEQQPLNR